MGYEPAVLLLDAAVSARFLSELLFGVSVYDPTTYLIVTGALVAAGLLATLLPAHRASTVDPMRVQRVEQQLPGLGL